MRWQIALAVLLGGCSQAMNGIGLSTGSITSSEPAPRVDAGKASGPAAPAPAWGAAAPTASPAASAVVALKASAPVGPAAPAVVTPVAAAPAAAAPAAPARVVGAERVSGNLYRVMTTDRVLSDKTDRENYALLKAAETTLAAGGTHFVMVSAANLAATGMPSLASLTNGSSGMEYGAYFRVFNVEPGAKAPIGAMAADEMVHFFGPKFGRAAG